MPAKRARGGQDAIAPAEMPSPCLTVPCLPWVARVACAGAPPLPWQPAPAWREPAPTELPTAQSNVTELPTAQPNEAGTLTAPPTPLLPCGRLPRRPGPCWCGACGVEVKCLARDSMEMSTVALPMPSITHLTPWGNDASEEATKRDVSEKERKRERGGRESALLGTPSMQAGQACTVCTWPCVISARE